MSYEDAFQLLLKHEGDTYTNDPNDYGGPTKYGITLKTYQILHPEATAITIENLTLEQAKIFYKVQFWDKLAADFIRDPRLAVVLFDLSVNTGSFHAIKMVQRACGAPSDGLLGPNTLAAINASNSHITAFKMLTAQLGAYTDLAIAQPKDLVFLKGWHNRIIDLLNYLLQ